LLKILVSSCLLGNPVRYDGQNNLIDNPQLQLWVDEGIVIPFCPEISAGLLIPRAPAEIQNGTGNDVLCGQSQVIDIKGNNITDAFISGANQALNLCIENNIKLAILAKNSPSCGSSLIYNGNFTRTLIPGSGVTAALLKLNDILVFDQLSIDRARVAFEKQ